MQTSRYSGTKIAITLSKNNFRAWFLAQIVQNRATHLSGPFLGREDIFGITLVL
jgi:hypothetical protein